MLTSNNLIDTIPPKMVVALKVLNVLGGIPFWFDKEGPGFLATSVTSLIRCGVTTLALIILPWLGVWFMATTEGNAELHIRYYVLSTASEIHYAQLALSLRYVLDQQNE